MREGKGIAYLSNGNKYDGEWKNNMKDGKGIFYYKNGNRYEGDWKNNRKEGKGTFYFQNGNRYEGDIKNDLREGKGIGYYFNLDIIPRLEKISINLMDLNMKEIGKMAQEVEKVNFILLIREMYMKVNL